MTKPLVLVKRQDPDREAIAAWLEQHGYSVLATERLSGVDATDSPHGPLPLVVVDEEAIGRADELQAFEGHRIVVLGFDRPLDLPSSTRRIGLPCRLDELLEAVQAEPKVDPREARSTRHGEASRAAGAVPLTLLRGIAHSLNNPLAAASGWLQLLEMDTGSQSPSARRTVEQLRGELTRIEKLTQAFSIIGGRPGGLAIPFDPLPLLIHVCRNARDEGLDVVIRGPQRRAVGLKGDPVEFELLFELILASYLDDRCQAGRVEITVVPGRHGLTLNFEDEGGILEAGPEPSDLSLLFRRTRHLRAIAIALADALVRRRHDGSVQIIGISLRPGARLELTIPGVSMADPLTAESDL